MAKFVIFLLLGVALASAAPGLTESPKLSNITGREKGVFVMGNAGSGKTTLAALLGGAELSATELNSGTYILRFTDEKQLIPSSSLPRTSLQINIFTDVQSNTTFYDLPGFGDTDRVRNHALFEDVRDEISSSSESVKFLLVVSHDSVRFGGSESSFLIMLDRVARILDDVERYGNAIAMVVNKVKSTYNQKHKLLEDESIIDGVVNYLMEAENYLEKKNEKETDEKEKSVYKRKIEMIKILLQRGDDNAYEKISILRRPVEAGPISNMELLMKEKANILHMVNENLQYARVH